MRYERCGCSSTIAFYNWLKKSLVSTRGFACKFMALRNSTFKVEGSYLNQKKSDYTPFLSLFCN
jgi:hypothetical protein